MMSNRETLADLVALVHEQERVKLEILKRVQHLRAAKVSWKYIAEALAEPVSTVERRYNGLVVRARNR